MTGGKNIAEMFCTSFAVHPHVYRAPGRVNLIGDHADHDDWLGDARAPWVLLLGSGQSEEGSRACCFF
jgi:hypothetical protein